jgi:hypothetical protein
MLHQALKLVVCIIEEEVVIARNESLASKEFSHPTPMFSQPEYQSKFRRVLCIFGSERLSARMSRHGRDATLDRRR